MQLSRAVKMELQEMDLNISEQGGIFVLLSISCFSLLKSTLLSEKNKNSHRNNFFLTFKELSRLENQLF